MLEPKKCFLSYAHQDRQGLERLLVHLRPYMMPYGIDFWHDGGIKAGSYWNEKINTEIANSQIFVLLTTNDFLGSDYVYHYELPAIMKQHKEAKALVLPVIYRMCGWRRFFADYIQVLPMDRKQKLLPVWDWKDREKALALVADSIGDAIQDWFGLPPSQSPLAARGPEVP